METDSLKKKRGRPRIKDGAKPNLLSQYREQRGLTQKELADLIGVKVSTINNAENYGRSLGRLAWYKLADIFEVDPRILEGKKIANSAKN